MQTSSTSRKSKTAATIPVDAWVVGDGAKQVPVAGMLADDPTLVDTELTPEEWEERLEKYLQSPRPPVAVEEEPENTDPPAPEENDVAS